MKIIHVLASNRYSGAENVVCQIIEMFRNEPGYEMIYCSPDGEISETLKTRDIPFAPMQSLSLSEIKRIIKDESPDIIHAHDRKASLICAMACGDIRLISHIHNNPAGARKISTESIGYIPAGMRAEHIFWVSQEAYDEYRFKHLFEKKSSILKNIIIGNRIVNMAELDLNKYDYDIVFVGRMEYQKNPERFVEIMRKIHQIKPEIKAAMAGTGKLEAEVRQLISEYELTNVIDVLGFKDNPYKLIRDSKVLLLPSRWEGLPMVQLEAEALGTWVVRTPGTDEELISRTLDCLDILPQITDDSEKIHDYKEKLISIYEQNNS